MPFEPIVPKGQHLGTSHEVGDAVTGHLFEDGTNKLKGHAAWREVDEPDTDDSDYDHEPPRELTPEEIERAAEVAALILLGIIWAVTKAKPHVKRWWSGTAVPGAKSAWARVSGLRRSKRQVAAAETLVVTRPNHAGPATGAEVALAKSQISMSTAEWQRRFQAMLAAGAFRDAQLRILSSARIDDGDQELNAQHGAEQLTPQQFADRIRSMLEANPSLLNDETSDELIRVFSTRRTQARPELEQ